jgi:hypothetical protein
MSTDLSNYDIYVYKGNTFKLDFKYTDNLNQGVDLSNYEAKIQIRRSAYTDKIVAEITEKYPTGSFGGGLTGDFYPGQGFTGFTGGLILNADGITGSIKIHLDSETSFSIPVGKHFYDLELKDSSTGIQRTIIRGKFNLLPCTINVERSAPSFIGEPGLTGESG